MIIYLLIAGAVIFLAGGVFFIRRADESSVENQKIVPISDFKEVKQSGGKGTEEKSLFMENKQLTEALKREVASKKANTISDQEREEIQKKEEGFLRSQQSIKELTEENHKLKKQMTDQEKKFNQFFESVAVAREDFGKEIEDYQRNIAVIKDELKQLHQEKEVFVEKNKSIEQLEAENKNLVAQVNKGEEAIKGLRADLEDTKFSVEQQKIEESVEGTSLSLPEEQGDSFKRLSNNAIFGQSPSDAIKTELAESTHMIEKLVVEKENLKRDKINWELDLSKIKDMNEHLLEKETKLQNELIKNRAQSYGLERVCEDFKVQIEMLSNTKSIK